MGAGVVIVLTTSLVSFYLGKRFGARAMIFPATILTALFFLFLARLPEALSGETVIEHTPWIPELQLSFSYYLNTLSLSFALLTLGAGAVILFYSAFYFVKADRSAARFGAYFTAFAGVMLGLVLSDNIYLFFIFWELTTVLSFLLIAHNHTLRAARSAAQQALVITTLGGLAMFVGFVILSEETGSASINEIFSATLPMTPVTVTAFYLVLAGALTKSAIFPFHFWLPGAMAAPTPVSAYLHAAAMVKAGVLMIALTAPVLDSVPGANLTIFILGAITMIIGGLRAVRQDDLKLLVAHSTVSQLGMIFMLYAVPSREVRTAAFLLVFAHAIAKAPLFLAVGAVDKTCETRSLAEIRNQKVRDPIVSGAAILAAFSLGGIPVLIGFTAKELALTSLINAPGNISVLAAVVFVAGGILTLIYLTRFVLGISFSQKIRETVWRVKKPLALGISTLAFSLAALAAGILPFTLTLWLTESTKAYGAPLELSLWHGFTAELGITLFMIVLGVGIGYVTYSRDLKPLLIPETLTASHTYWRVMHVLDIFAVRATSLFQRGSLPWYLAVILIVTAVSIFSKIPMLEMPGNLVLFQSPLEIPFALAILITTIWALRANTRFKIVILVGITGFSMVGIFAIFGAPDLALTQALVETATLITFILVIRKLPRTIDIVKTKINLGLRLVISLAAGLAISLAAMSALAQRQFGTISEAFARLAVEGGHGLNIVNVTLVDIRVWDTVGELSVVVASATGIASLIFIKSRGDNLPKISRADNRATARSRLVRIVDPEDDTNKSEWILAGEMLDPERRSIILEVVIRLIFHATIIFSVYLLLAGHNAPGGGFTAGLVAGLALAARYLAGGRFELGATVTIDAGKLLGTGMVLATGVALVPLLFGQEVFTSTWFEINLGPLGVIPFVTSTVFDIGVYLVVIGLLLDVLRSLGAEIDIQDEVEDREEWAVLK